jgi:hypothetical protein
MMINSLRSNYSTELIKQISDKKARQQKVKKDDLDFNLEVVNKALN